MGTSAVKLPPLPAGFELETDSDLPPLPAGFQLEGSRPTDPLSSLPGIQPPRVDMRELDAADMVGRLGVGAVTGAAGAVMGPGTVLGNMILPAAEAALISNPAERGMTRAVRRNEREIAAASQQALTSGNPIAEALAPFASAPVVNFGSLGLSGQAPRGVARQLAKGTEEFASSLTQPVNAMLGAGSMAVKAGSNLQRLMSMGFSLDMISHATEAAPEIAKLIEEGDIETAARMIPGAIGSTLMAGMAGAHAIQRPAGPSAYIKPMTPAERVRTEALDNTQRMGNEELLARETELTNTTTAPKAQQPPELQDARQEILRRNLQVEPGERTSRQQRRQSVAVPEEGPSIEQQRMDAARETIAERLGINLAEAAPEDLAALDQLAREGYTGNETQAPRAERVDSRSPEVLPVPERISERIPEQLAEPAMPEVSAADSNQATPAPTARQPKTLPVYGRDTEVLIPGEKKKYTATYSLREAEDVIASHSGQSFEPRPDYEFKNDRNYSEPQNAERIVKQTAEFDPAFLVNDNPTAEQGPPIIDWNGNVLGGNSRTMTLERVRRSSPEAYQQYRERIREESKRLGLDPAAVDKMKEPVLVRQIVDQVTDPQAAITDFNKVGTAELRQAERAIADSRRLSTASLDDITRRIEEQGPEGTLARALDGDAVGLINRLTDDGVLTLAERPRLMDGQGRLTAEGKQRMTRLLTGRLFEDARQFEETAPELRNKLERVVAPLAKAEGVEGWAITDQVKEAVRLAEEARNRDLSIDELTSQRGMFGDRNYSPEAIAIAKKFQDKPTEVAKAFRQYAAEAEMGAGGQMMMGMKPPSAAESFRAAFRTLDQLKEDIKTQLKDQRGSLSQRAATRRSLSQNLTELAGIYLREGIQKFSEFSKRAVAEVGRVASRLLVKAWTAARRMNDKLGRGRPERGSLSNKAEVVEGRPLWEMGPEELQAELDRAKTKEQANLVRLFGAEGAKKYKALERRANGSMTSFEEMTAATKEMEAMERAAPFPKKEVDRLLYGIDDPSAIDPAKVRQYQQALNYLDFENEAQVGASVAQALMDVGDVRDPRRTTDETKQIAYAKLRYAMTEAKRLGMDTGKITEAAIKTAKSKFSDPADARFMLRHVLKEAPEKRALPSAAGKPAELLRKFDAMRRGDSGPESIREIRKQFPDWSKEEFDQAAIELSKRGEIQLDYHDAPMLLSPERRAELVFDPTPTPSDPKGTYFVKMTPRRRRSTEGFLGNQRGSVGRGRETEARRSRSEAGSGGRGGKTTEKTTAAAEAPDPSGTGGKPTERKSSADSPREPYAVSPNLKKSRQKAIEKMGLDEKTMEQVDKGLTEWEQSNPDRRAVTFEDIRNEAREKDPMLLAQLDKTAAQSEVMRDPGMRYAAKNAINAISREQVTLAEKLADKTIVGEERARLQRQADQLERDFRKLTDIIIPTRSQIGRTLAFERMMAEQSFDVTYWLDRAKKAQGFPEDVPLPEDVVTKVKESAKRGQDAEAAAVDRVQGDGPMKPEQAERQARKELGPEPKAQPERTRVKPRERRGPEPKPDPTLEEKQARYKEKLLKRIKELAEDKAKEKKTSKWELTPEQRAEVERDPEVRAAAQQMARTLRDLHKDGWLKFLLSARAAGLLTAPGTHIRNLSSNLAYQVFNEASRPLGWVADSLVRMHPKATGERAVQGIDAAAIRKASHDGAVKGWEEAKRIMKTGEAPDEGTPLWDFHKELNAKHLFENRPVLKHLAWTNDAINTVFRSLKAGDRFFKRSAFRRSLEEQMATSKVKVPTEEMMIQAWADADFLTFNNQNQAAKALGNATSWARKQGLAGKTGAAVIDFFLPFKNTPANVWMRGFEAMGGGLVTGPVKLFMSEAKLTAAQQRAISMEIGRGATGAGIVLMGMIMYQNGTATGMHPQDERGEREMARAAGKQDGAIKIGGRWVSINGLSPLANLLNVGATLGRKYGEWTDFFTNPDEALAIFTATVKDQPMLRGAQDLIEAVQGSNKAPSLVAGAAGSMIPSIVSAVGQASDDVMRDARGGNIAERAGKGVANRVPGLRQTLPPRLDAVGRPVPQDRIGALFGFPTTVEDDRPALREMSRVKVSMSPQQQRKGETTKAYEQRMKIARDKGELPPERLPDEPREAFETRARATGEATLRRVERMMNEPQYKSLTDDEKQQRIEAAIRRIRSRASREARSPQYQGMTPEQQEKRLLQVLR